MIPVVAAVIRRGDTVLLARRPPEKRHGGLWEFPGGKLQEGESAEGAARRELREELDLALDALGPELFAVADPESAFRIQFHLAVVQGTPKALEHAEIRWCDGPSLARLDLAPADAQFARFYLGSPPPDDS